MEKNNNNTNRKIGTAVTKQRRRTKSTRLAKDAKHWQNLQVLHFSLLSLDFLLHVAQLLRILACLLLQTCPGIPYTDIHVTKKSLSRVHNTKRGIGRNPLEEQAKFFTLILRILKDLSHLLQVFLDPGVLLPCFIPITEQKLQTILQFLFLTPNPE